MKTPLALWKCIAAAVALVTCSVIVCWHLDSKFTVNIVYARCLKMDSRLEEKQSNRTHQRNNNITSEPLWQGDEGRIFANYGQKGCKEYWGRDILIDLLKKWNEIAKNNTITYFLVYGSMLGSFRNSDKIPYDTDIDVIVSMKDYKKLKSLEDKRNFTGRESTFHIAIQPDLEKPIGQRRHISCQGKEIKAEDDKCSFKVVLGRLISRSHHLDIWHYQAIDGRLQDPLNKAHRYNASDVFPLKRCLMMGVETWCARNPRQILTVIYGRNLNPDRICRNGSWVKSR